MKVVSALQYLASPFKIGLSLFGCAEKYTLQSTHCALEGANVVCAGASLTIPGLLCSLMHPLLGALTWNQLAEVQPQVDDIQLELREAPDKKAQPLFSEV